MESEYEVSTRLVFWGSRLNTVHLAQDIGLDVSFCNTENKGDNFGGESNGRSARVAKTNTLRYTYDRQFPNSQRSPYAQLEYFAQKLNNLSKLSDNKNKFEKAELQISIYYKNSTPGEVTFKFPDMLLSELSRHQIQLTFTVLP